MSEFAFVPKGTQIEEPDDINRVTLTFATQNDAIVFYEMLISLHNGELELRLGKPGTLEGRE